MSYDPTRTRLENYLSNHPSTRPLCGCGAPVEMHIAHTVYLKCPKCNTPKSKVLTLERAGEIQGMEIPMLQNVIEESHPNYLTIGELK